MSDRIFGAVGLLLAALFAYSSLIIEESFLSDAVGPKAFPLIIAGILAISSLTIVIKTGRSAQMANASPALLSLWLQLLSWCSMPSSCQFWAL